MGWDGDIENKSHVVRLKREHCTRTKHDSLFSPWKVLIGPFDWEDHSTGKEGADRYRVHNLPNSTSCSGIYELGIAKTISRIGTRKLDNDYIVPVYIGQADNVRTRIQQYGREGAHLERGKLNGEQHGVVHQGPRLFSDIFWRGYSIVFRWAPMKNKSDAERAEAQLLDTFDYAWNKGSNGIRRPNDIHKKLDRISSKITTFPNIATKLRIFRPKKMGIKIKACNTDSNLEKNNLFSRIFKIGRSRPREVSSRLDLYKGSSICGVALGHGSVCQKPLVEGRKRCNEHKGMKINGINPKLTRGESFHKHEVSVDFEGNVLFTVCGVTLENGMICDRKPVQGRKRCVEHKGRRINGTNPKLSMEESFHKHEVTADFEWNVLFTACGVTLDNGMVCDRKPVQGRKRCVEHKGRRITGSSKSTPHGKRD